MDSAPVPDQNLDTIITYAYRNAHYFKVPVRLLSFVQVTGKNFPNIFPVTNVIDQEFGLNAKSLYETYLSASSITPGLQEEDIPFFVIMEYRRDKTTSPVFSETFRRRIYSFSEEQLVALVNDYFHNFDDLIQRQGNRYGNYSQLTSSVGSWLGILEHENKFDEQLYEIVYTTHYKLHEIMSYSPHINIPAISNINVSIPETFVQTTYVIDKSNLEETGRQISLDTMYQGKPVRAEMGLDIFNGARATLLIPFIQYHDNEGHTYTKVYHSDDTIAPLEYSKLLPNIRNPLNNILYFQVYIGKPEDLSLSSIVRQNFYLVHYNLGSNYMLLRGSDETESEDEEDNITDNTELLKERVLEAFPHISFMEESITKVSGQFMMFLETSQNIPAYWPSDPNITYNSENQLRILGVDEAVLFSLIINDPIFRQFLYIEESKVPYADKRRFDIHFRPLLVSQIESITSASEQYISNSANVSFTLSNRINKVERTVVTDLHTSGRVIKVGMPYIEVNITNGKSHRDVYEFMNIFYILMRYYQYFHLSNRIALYKNYPAELSLSNFIENRKTLEPLVSQISKEPIKPRRGRKPGVRSVNSDRLNLLRDKFPKTFNYSKVSTVMSTTNAVQWVLGRENFNRLYAEQQNKIMRYSKNLNNNVPQVLEYPRNSELYFYCTSDDKPYIGLKLNTQSESNNPDEKYFPACFVKDNLGKPDSSINTYLKAISSETEGQQVSVEVLQKRGRKGKEEKKTHQLADIGVVSRITSAISSVILSYSPDAGEISRVRYHNTNSPNSLIHCVLGALNDPVYFGIDGYYNIDTAEKREEYCQWVRRTLATTIHLEVLRQENVTTPLEELMARLLDTNSYFDPLLFYRLLEEAYGINLYFFGYEEKTEGGKMLLPYSRGFTARPLRPYRSTVLILLSHQVDRKTYQAEIIVDKRPISPGIFGLVKIFGVSLTYHLHKIFLALNSTATWISPEITTDNSYGGLPLQLHRDIYDIFDPLEVFDRFTPVGQTIDKRGKMRSINFVDGEFDSNGQFIPDSGSGQHFTICTLPGQPVNLPVTKEIYYADVDFILTFLPKPSMITREQGGNINGLWYQVMDLIAGMFIPVNLIKSYPQLEKLPLGKPQLYPYLVEENVTEKISRLRRKMNIILQLLKYLFEYARFTLGIKTVDEYWSQYTVVMNENPDENIYDISHLHRILPDDDTYDEVVAKLSHAMPRAFAGKRFVFYNQTLAKKCYEYLHDYVRNTDQPMIPSYLKYYYMNAGDFSHHPNNYLFIDDKSFKTWLKQYTSGVRNFARIQPAILPYDNDPSPYFYSAPIDLKADQLRISRNELFGKEEEEEIFEPTSKIYMIQKVENGSLQRALQVAYYWNLWNINLGYDSMEYSKANVGKPLPNFAIWGIDNLHHIIPFEDRRNGASTFLEVLYYGSRYGSVEDGYFAAMIPI